MNPDLPIDPRQALEASLTALLLGELPPDQEAFLRQAMAQDAELARIHERLRRTIELVRETEASPASTSASQAPPLKLNEARRQDLLQRFKTVAPKEFAEPARFDFSRVVGIAAAVLILALLASMLLPSHSRSKSKSMASASYQTLGRQSHSGGAGEQFSVLAPTVRHQLAADDSVRDQAGKTETQQLFDNPKIAQPAQQIAAVKNPRPNIVLPTALEPKESGDVATANWSVNGELRGFYDDNKVAGARSEEKLSEGKETQFGLYTPAVAPTISVGGPAGRPLEKQPLAVTLSSGEMRDAIVDPSTGLPLYSATQPAAVLEPATGLPVAAPAGDSIALSFQSGAGGGGGFGGVAQGGRLGVAPAQPKPTAAPPAPGAADPANETAFRRRYALNRGESATTGGQAPNVRLSESLATITAIDPSTGLPIASDNLSHAAKDVENSGIMAGNLIVAATPADGFISPQTTPAGGVALGVTKGKVPVLGDTPLIGHVFNDDAFVVGDGFSLQKSTDGDVARLKSTAVRQMLPEEKLRETLSNKDEQSDKLGDTTYRYRVPAETPVGGVASLGLDLKPTADRKQVAEEAKLGVVSDFKGGRSSANEQNNMNSMLLGPESLQRIEKLRLETQADLDREKQRLAKLKNLQPSELAQALPNTGVPDPALNSLLEQLTIANQKLYSLKKEQKTDGRDVAAAEAKVADLTKRVDDRVSGAMRGLEAKTESLEQGLHDLDKGIQTAKNPDERAAADSELGRARRQLEELQKARTTLYAEIAKEGGKEDLELPKSSTAEIVDLATPQAARDEGLTAGLRSAFSSEVQRSARIKVERDQNTLQGTQASQTGAAYDPYFVQTEFETIRSDAVLGKVAKNLNLADTWGEKTAGRKLDQQQVIKKLKDSLNVQAVPNTSLVDIRVKDSKPEEAARIANAVAEAYVAQRLESRKQQSISAVNSLTNLLAEQEAKVKLAQAEVDRLRRLTSPTNTDTAPPKPATPAPIPQPEVQVRDNAFSTFSLNISDVSFKLAAASLEKGVMPEPSGIRSEEFINAFDYHDPEAPAGVPIAFAWERARYPFAQNRDLLRLSLKTAAQGRQVGRPLNVVLLLDNSGSMERSDRVRIIQEALRLLASQLQPQDKLSVILFARTARLWVDGVPGNQAAQVAEEVGGITPQGGTNLEEAMNLAYQTARRHYFANGINRVVLLTDGAANLGNVEPEALKRKVEDHRKQGIAFDCFGIGWEGYNDDLLEVLSRNGDGRYGFINTPEEAATEFAGQLAGALHVAASDVKVQVEFNPARVNSYRQIGYAKHQLTKEQFRDNTVDAAEIGAAEAGNALYVVEVNPKGEGPLAIVRVRYKLPGTVEYYEREWAVPFTGNAQALDQASPGIRLAAASSAFSEWLAASPYATEVSPDALLGYLRGIPEVYGADQRPAKLEWMIRQAKSLAGK